MVTMSFSFSLFLVMLQTWSAMGLPQTATTAAEAQCLPTIATVYGIAATVTDYGSFVSSMNSRFSTPGVSFTGTSVPFFTSVVDVEGGGQYTGYGNYDSEALKSAGYSIIASVITTSTCLTSSTTPTLPPSPTGSLCSPHVDHWHCQPYPTATDGTPSSAAGECEPHDDHWHCPPGVPEPTTPPSDWTETTSAATSAAGECEPHIDHWHCPPGVAEPTTPPGGATATQSTETLATGPSNTEASGAGRIGGPGWALLVFGLVGVAIL